LAVILKLDTEWKYLYH